MLVALVALASIGIDPPAWPCTWVGGFLVPYADSPEHPGECVFCVHDRMFVLYRDADDPSPRIVYPGNCRVWLASDPRGTLAAAEAVVPGRPVEFCLRHFDEIRLPTGMHPAAYRRAALRELALAPARRRGLDPAPADRIVRLGLGSDCYATREAAQRRLARDGPAALPALIRGLASPDAEVRFRCARTIDRIRHGTVEEE
jgi:hypothetical protein